MTVDRPSNPLSHVRGSETIILCTVTIDYRQSHTRPFLATEPPTNSLNGLTAIFEVGKEIMEIPLNFG